MARPPAASIVRWVVVVSVAITALHYTDNYVSIANYPQPAWIQRETIILAWVLFTFVGVAGYMLYKAGRSMAAGAYLLVYSATGISSLGHYFSSGHSITTKMHLFIWTDAVVGFLVAGCALWILLSLPRKAATAAS